MQAETVYGGWEKPEAFEAEKLKTKLRNKRIRSVCVFESEDEDGKPTPELRRAWRRYEQTTNKRR